MCLLRGAWICSQWRFNVVGVTRFSQNFSATHRASSKRTDEQNDLCFLEQDCLSTAMNSEESRRIEDRRRPQRLADPHPTLVEEHFSAVHRFPTCACRDSKATMALFRRLSLVTQRRRSRTTTYLSRYVLHSPSFQPWKDAARLKLRCLDVSQSISPMRDLQTAYTR